MSECNGYRCSDGIYRRLSFKSRKTNRTNLRAVKASARLCWYLFTSLYLEDVPIAVEIEVAVPYPVMG